MELDSCGDKAPLRILVATSFPDDLPEFDELPRGMCAIPHYLRQFGHTITHIGARDSLRVWKLIRVIGSFRPNVVLCHQRAALILGVLRKFRLVRVPVVHAWDDYYAEQNPLPTWLIWPFEKLSVRFADFIVAASPYNLHLAKSWGMKGELIPHGVTADVQSTSLRIESARLKVIYLGAQLAYKGSFDLVESVRDLPCDLFMVGEINPEVQLRAPPNVHFVGPVPQPQVLSVLRQADILINSSNQDSNFKIYDYIRAGKPLVGIKGRAEWALKNGEEALLVDNLRDGLQKLINDPSLRDQLAANIARKPLFTWEQIARKHEEVLRRVARR